MGSLLLTVRNKRGNESGNATNYHTNAVDYGSYWGRRYIRYKDHPSFRPVPTFEKAISTVCPLPDDQQ